LNRALVLLYRLPLEAKKLASPTINVGLAAVRRMAHEAIDTGLLSPELVAGIRRVSTQLGRRDLSIGDVSLMWIESWLCVAAISA
jgi:hypothetical protein